MELDPVILSRLQFASTVAFHILFPTLTIGLAAFLAFVEGAWLRTGEAAWHDLYRFWVKIFALTFGMGVVSGIPMSFQFGTNWATFSSQTGNIVGPLLGYEVLTAFFLEASFLGIMLFGWNRVGRRLHFTATLAVAFGTALSAFWILAANSWMQTPQGYTVNAHGVFEVESWWAAIFTPSFPYRFCHMLLASWLSTSFVVMAVSAWQVLRHRYRAVALKALRMAVVAAAVLAPLQILAGDQHGLNTLEYQPLKVAAMEGNWETGPAKPLLLFAWPDQAAQRNDFEIGIPKGASLILTHRPDGTVPGLDDVPASDQPPVAVVFFAFRIMVGLGFLMLGVAWLAWLLRRTLQNRDNLLRLLVAMGPSGFLAVLAGWTVTEVGRQPWVVYGQLRVADAVSVGVQGQEIMTSLMLFAIVYSLIFATFVYFLVRLVRAGPAPQSTTPPPALAATAALQE